MVGVMSFFFSEINNKFFKLSLFFCQDAQQERSTFVSSLLPLLAEYSLQPPVPDAQSIVSNVKVSPFLHACVFFSF